MQENLSVDFGDGVQLIRFDRAEYSNALTADMFDAASDAISIGERDSRVRTFLICGMPGVFTAGHDTGEISRFITEGNFGASAVRFFKTMATVDKPIIAAVDGVAFGIGTTMLLLCDFVVASEWAIFSAPFVDIGTAPEAGSSLLAPHLMGYHRAFELIVMGEQFDAHRAFEAGLVNKVVPPEEVDNAALGFARALAARPPEAVRLARRLLRGGDRRDVLQRIDQEAAAFVELLRSPAARDALIAFVEKKR
jgi:enoyl-CoA hydratase/carnithine racemase